MLAKIRCIRLSGKRASMKAQKALEAAMPSTRWDQRKTVSRVTAQSKTKKAVSAQVRILPKRLGIFRISCATMG